MKALRFIFFGILSVIGLFLFVALLVKKDYNVSREIVINKPKQVVFDYIKQLRNQATYSPWARLDPNMKTTYTGTDATVGFKYTWDGNDAVGQGEQTITNISEGNEVDFGLHFVKPFDGLASAKMKTTAVSETQTKVTWSLASSMQYPANIMLLVVDMNKVIGEDYQKGLVNLKVELDK